MGAGARRPAGKSAVYAHQYGQGLRCAAQLPCFQAATPVLPHGPWRGPMALKQIRICKWRHFGPQLKWRAYLQRPIYLSSGCSPLSPPALPGLRMPRALTECDDVPPESSGTGGEI